MCGLFVVFGVRRCAFMLTFSDEGRKTAAFGLSDDLMREVFFGRRGLALTHIVLFSDSQSPAHAAAHDAMRDAYASYAGSAMNIWM